MKNNSFLDTRTAEILPIRAVPPPTLIEVSDKVDRLIAMEQARALRDKAIDLAIKAIHSEIQSNYQAFLGTFGAIKAELARLNSK